MNILSLLTLLLVCVQSQSSSSGIQTALVGASRWAGAPPALWKSWAWKWSLSVCFGGCSEGQTLLISATDVTKRSITSNREPLQDSTSKQEEHWLGWWSSLFSITEMTVYSNRRKVITWESYSIKDTELDFHSNPFISNGFNSVGY